MRDYKNLVKKAIRSLKRLESLVANERAFTSEHLHSSLMGRVARVFDVDWSRATHLCEFAGEDPNFREVPKSSSQPATIPDDPTGLLAAAAELTETVEAFQHANFSVCGTQTGRWTSTTPNAVEVDKPAHWYVSKPHRSAGLQVTFTTRDPAIVPSLIKWVTALAPTDPTLSLMQIGEENPLTELKELRVLRQCISALLPSTVANAIVIRCEWMRRQGFPVAEIANALLRSPPYDPAVENEQLTSLDKIAALQAYQRDTRDSDPPPQQTATASTEIVWTKWADLLVMDRNGDMWMVGIEIRNGQVGVTSPNGSTWGVRRERYRGPEPRTWSEHGTGCIRRVLRRP